MKNGLGFYLTVAGFVMLWVVTAVPAQKTLPASGAAQQAAKGSAAYSEVVLRRAEVEAELEALLLDFTEEYPKVRNSRYTLSQLQKQLDTIAATKPADVSRLTLALGKLMVKRTELDTDLWALLQNLADGHPDVRRAKRKLEIFDKAIKEILG